MVNKFRVWDKVAKRYQDPSKCLSVNAEGEVVVPKAFKDSLVIEAFAQCKDKDGDEVYQGDIVSDNFHSYKIVWTDDYGFMREYIGSEKLHFSGLQTMSTCRIIGTIRDEEVSNAT